MTLKKRRRKSAELSKIFVDQHDYPTSPSWHDVESFWIVVLVLQVINLTIDALTHMCFFSSLLLHTLYMLQYLV